MIGLADVVSRMHRLEELGRGLAKEVALWKQGNDPLLYLERKSYLNAIQDALAGVEEARVALARVRQRLEQNTQKLAPTPDNPPVPGDP